MTSIHLAAGRFVAQTENVNPLVPKLPEIILVLIVFGALWYLIAKFVAPRFEESFAQRRDAIEGGIARAEAAQAEAQAALQQYRRQLAEARGEAAQIRENARAEAQRIVEELRAQAQEESARIIARGEEQLASQRGAVVRELRGEIGTLAVELSEKIVNQRLADDAQVSATVDAFLADLEQRDAADSGAGSTP
ncbi:MAG: F-type H+-transporting ATPase subunit b [Pseudonocardiales bacterium]|nr:F-type H+-transporting ATPase subunit b [Pseudonocardiales bacterium]